MLRALVLALLWGGVAQAASLPITITFQSADPITMGETAILSDGDSGNGNLLLAQGPYTLAQAATLQSLSFYVGSTAGNLILGVFDASGSGGGPGALVAQTASFAPSCTPLPCWVTRATTTTPTMQPGNYWLAYTPSSSSLSFRKTTAGVGAKFYSRTFQAMPATFSTSPTPDPAHWSFYATLLPTAPPPPQPLSISFSPSNPSVACNAPVNTPVTSVQTQGGTGGPIAYDISGDAAFGLSSTTPPASVIVTSSLVSKCGTAATVDVGATQ